ncbi:hypothetical protein NEF87_004749 [Candidatus Lokiarchaeum ossiferum]|uniref:Uncharacterized protein n=1 Tax=Candidatus Lokiarchaeum ossiferum TaxID=2951803 RepID=A0ABY6I186_9ARCH|nr:hypothetical protein NEF87_004749 [Candidatus Lokiarchaeum sp. B-35]
MVNFLDFELELQHLVFIFLVSLTWIAMSFWGRYELLTLYNPLPDAIHTFISVSFWIGGGGVAIGIGLILYTVLE